MTEALIKIEAFDCLPFYNEKATADVLQKFIASQSKNIFWFSANYSTDDDFKLAEFDYKNNRWNAGRFIGEAIFSHNGMAYKISIKPRFGEKILFRMLEEIFNIQITSSASQHSLSKDWQHFIRRIISFIWLQKLANANLHGIPKTQVKKEHRGETIRGRLDVRKSIKSFYQNKEIVSCYQQKHFDSAIGQIIHQVYQILKNDFHIGGINIPDSAKEVINHVKNVFQYSKNITETDFKNISYKEIYLNWKPVVDMSWDIIKQNQLSLQQDKANKGFGFFIDMAEVWEQYLRAILKKSLIPIGWHYRNDKQIAYKGYFFKRELIPDLVFQKENDIIVWDAKYKRMLGRPIDIDRSDFFQIHTYIQNYINHKRVRTAGLLFPISTQQTNFEEYTSPYLINEEGVKMNFHIDGIELTEKDEVANLSIRQVEFVNRIIKSIS